MSVAKKPNIVFRPNEQYRCTTIRGKAQRDMDDLLPLYANIIAEICPCNKSDFDTQFNERLSKSIYGQSFDALKFAQRKTIRNHVTEIAGSLFGLYYYDIKGNYYESPSNKKLLEDEDQPAFFKNLCLNSQFPTGSQKPSTIKERIVDGINLKPFHFIISLLALANERDIKLTKDEIGYYVLNAKQVLQGKVSILQVLDRILDDRGSGITNSIVKDSYNWQHIREQFNLLVLANLVTESDELLLLNTKESKVISYFIEQYDKPLNFDMSKYDLELIEGRRAILADWSEYYGKVAVKNHELLDTDINAIVDTEPSDSDNQQTDVTKSSTSTLDKNALGAEGESYVFELERRRVSLTHPRLVNQVRLLASQRGIGYDISSVEAALDQDNPEFLKMIEVKSTKRVTVPPMEDENWIDTINLTRREWMTAKQNRSVYSIYRVYFTKGLVVVREINDPYTKFEEGLMQVVPTNYRADFGNSAIDKGCL